MTVPEWQSVFATMTDKDIAEVGLQAAEVAFDHDCSTGLVDGGSLAVVVGVIEHDAWIELGWAHFGPSADKFDVNIDPLTGKLATVIDYGMNSIDAYWGFDTHVPEGPQRWTGGVHYVARVKTLNNGWMLRVFAGAASGVQGHYDQATTYTALTRMGAMWALKMQSIYGRAD